MTKVLNTLDISKILPYKYPMLLVDRVLVESETRYVGIKNLSYNEEFFQGHFPDHPIMPGVLQVEAMEQVAELAVKDKLDPNGTGNIYIKTLNKVKFRAPNNPGNRLLIEIDVDSIENNEAQITAITRNGEGKKGITCQAKLTLAVRPREFPTEMPDTFNEFEKDQDIAMDVMQVKELIPHRYPFLFVDYIKSCSEDGTVVGIKNVSLNEPIFQGCDPAFPVLPGAVQSEIIAQVGCVYMLQSPQNKGKIAYFMAIDKAEFYHPIFPGDQLICEVVIPPIKSRFGKGTGTIRVGDKIVSKTQMMFAIVDA